MPLKLGDAVVHLPLSGTTEELGRVRQAAAGPEEAVGDGPDRWDVDLSLVERRCRLKAASCRLFIEKRAAAAGSDAEFELRRRMDEMIAQAKAMPDCFLWVFWRERVQPEDAELVRIAQNYEAQAEAVALMRRVDDAATAAESEDESDALHLIAEANSALRGAMADTWLTGDDHDQAEIYVWLRRQTSARQVFIKRHMTTDDPADPANVLDLLERIRETNKRLDHHASRGRAIRSAIGRIRYHARLVARNGPAESADDWAKIAGAVAELMDLGIAASDRRIAEAVGPEAAALWPSESPAASGLAAVISRARGLAAGAEVEAGEELASSRREWSPAVLDVRARLRGGRIVIIGGIRNAAAADRLVEAFELTDAEWVALTEHGSAGPMRAPIQRGDTSLVIVIIKLCGHLHADEAKSIAKAAGKPCVLLTGGYNPERVAAAILEQASDRLPVVLGSALERALSRGLDA